ncbi:MAG: SusC/RagA family TonB-linked outer membrane protein [Bacteroidetes bacterium]|nr:SusC/RagA family TonB-linked outer membrane protein [Bacteroidota bacterium]
MNNVLPCQSGPIIRSAFLRACILCGLLAFSFTLDAQISISGMVLDELDDPMIGVSISEKGNPGNGTTTDLDGTFQLQISDESAVLVFKYIGYQVQERTVGDQRTFEVVMQEDARQLDEVVVTALGIKRQKRELGYSTEKFEGEDLNMSNAENLVSSLHGKSAGVQVSSGNGVDGGTTRVTIRGNNNINANNQPLIVVDGVPIENEPGLTDIGRGTDWGSAINNINPADIESVNILKGPTASAKYGSRGSNGVILITTKRGSQRKGIGIDYSIQHKIIQPCRFRDVQNIYGAGGPVTLNEPTFEIDANGTPIYPVSVHTSNGPFGKPTTELFGFYSTGVSWGPKMEGQMIRWWDGEMRPFSPQPDNLQQFFSNGNTTTHNLSFSGGNDFGTMRVSLTRTDHDAIIPNSNFNQTTVNIGSDLRISSRVKADISVSYINYHRLNSPSLGDDNNASFGKGILYSWPRSYKGLEEEINIRPDGTRNDYDGNYPFTYAPPHLWWNTYNQNTTLDRNKMIGSLGLQYDITNWLSLTGRLGMDLNFNQFETRHNPIDQLGILEGKYENELLRDIVRNNEVLLSARKENIFDSPLGVSLSAGGTQWSRSRYGIKIGSGEWINPWLYSVTNYSDQLSVPIPNEYRYDKKINSVYAFLNLSWENYLFLELSGRNDWSSALPVDNNSYFYPSGSLSFIATEAFSIENSWLSFLKLRGAYAQTATDTDPFQLNFIYETNAFGGSQTASLPNVIPPIALQPQQANSYEFGTTLGLFNNRINLDFTYYYIRSFDQILDAPTPASSGANTVRINTGELENKGFEAILNATLVYTPDFFLETGFNINRNRNYVISLGDGAEILELANIWGLNGPAIAVQEGDEYGTIVGYDYVYHPDNGQPILNEDGTHYLITESRVPVGNASPDFLGGWTLNMGYKGFTLNTLVDTKWGGDIYAGSYAIGLQTGQSPETLLERDGGGLPFTDPDGNVRNVGVVLPGVLEDGTTNEQVVHYLFKYIPNAGGWGRFLTTPGILENTWVKLREVRLTYTFPESFAKKTKVFQGLRISLVGRDLFYLYSSLPDQINPEGNNGSGNAQGLEWASFPGTRSFGFNINASF